MTTTKFQLSQTPNDPRQRELWLQHAVGFILFQDVREYALQQLEPSLTDDVKVAATKAINDAMYGLMMVLDGVTGALANDSMRVNLRMAVELVDSQTDHLVESLDVLDGDGMCMGYHGWLENDFGDPRPFVAELESNEDGQMTELDERLGNR